MAEYTLKINERTVTGKRLIQYLQSLNNVSLTKKDKNNNVKNSIKVSVDEMLKGKTKNIDTLWTSL